MPTLTYRAFDADLFRQLVTSEPFQTQLRSALAKPGSPGYRETLARAGEPGLQALAKLPVSTTGNGAATVRATDLFKKPPSDIILPLNRKTTRQAIRPIPLDTLEPTQATVAVQGLEAYVVRSRRDPPDVAHLVDMNGKERWVIQEGHTRLGAAVLRGDAEMPARVWEFRQDAGTGKWVPVIRGRHRIKSAYRDKLMTLAGEWDESLHPRDDDGKFGEGGGGGGASDDDSYGNVPAGEGQEKLFEFAPFEPEAGSEKALRREAEKAVTTMDAMLDDAVENAEFEGSKPESWDDLDSDIQNQAYDKWRDDQYSESWVSDAGSEAGDSYIDNELTGQRVFDAVMEDDDFNEHLKEAGIDRDTVDFVQYGSSSGRSEIEIDTATKDLKGEPLTDEVREKLDAAFAGASTNARDKLTEEIRESDAYTDVVSQAESEAISEEWDNNKDSSDKYGIADDLGLISTTSVDKEPPDTWTWDGDPSDEDYVKTHAVATELAKARTTDLMTERGLLVDVAGAGNGYSAEDLSQKIPGEFWSAWKGDSGSPLGNAMQMAVAAEMGTLPTAESDDPHKGMTESEKLQARAELVQEFTTSAERKVLAEKHNLAVNPTAALNEETREKEWKELGERQAVAKAEVETLAMNRAKAYVRAQWEASQYVMHKAGQDEVELYRAIILPKSEVEKLPLGKEYKSSEYAPAVHQLPDLKLLQNAVASTTTKPSVANDWHGAGGVSLDSNHVRVVLRFKVPRTAVFSLPVFGQNVEEESEVVLMGTKGAKWDAWLGAAPKHVAEPITLSFTLAKDKPKPPKTAKKGDVLVNLQRNTPTHWLKDYKKPTAPTKKALMNGYRGKLLALAGTSEGAFLGWETRRAGGSPPSESERASAVESVRERILKASGGRLAVLDLRPKANGDVELETIATARGEHDQGVGTKAMDTLTEWADEEGVRLILSPSQKGYQPVEKGAKTTSSSRLKQFYKRFGFVDPASKRHYDPSLSSPTKPVMVRPPRMKKHLMDLYGTSEGAVKGWENRERSPKEEAVAREWAAREKAIMERSNRAATKTTTPQFKGWFQDSAVVDAEGDPLVVFHGTTHNISEFKTAGDEGLNPESDWGAGVYFTSDPDDASENYAGEGPDLTSRLEQRVDQLQGEDEELSREDALAQARSELEGKSPSVIPVYLSMQKPLVIGEPNGSSDADETRLEMETEYADPDDPESDVVGEKGTLVDFMTALRDEASQHDDGDKAVDDFFEQLGGEDSITASKLVKLWKETESSSYITDDSGRLVQSEVFRAALERAGFDGVIDRTVYDKFGKFGEEHDGVGGMEHLEQDTTHFVVFQPTQAKSAIANQKFDPTNPDLALRSYRDKLKMFVLAGRVPAGRKDLAWDEVDHPRDDGGKFTDSGGGTSHWVGGGSAVSDARTFKGDEGYDWHEAPDRVSYAKELPKEDLDAINEYAGFGYGDMNQQLRGEFKPSTVNEFVRPATPEEIEAYEKIKWRESTSFQKRQWPPHEPSEYEPDDPVNKVEGGRVVHSVFQTDDQGNKVEYAVKRAAPDTKRLKEIKATTEALNTSIRERGYALPEAMLVNRAAYIPGMSHEDVKAMEGKVIEEKGFTSTMVGDPSRRFDGYVAHGRSESIYKRTGGKTADNDEVGTAMRVRIVLPKGTKVAAVEPVRRMKIEYERDKDGLRDFSKPKGREMDTDKGSRREAEVLLGSGAQFRVVSVKQGESIPTSRSGMRHTLPVTDVVLEYVGGGSSEAKK